MDMSALRLYLITSSYMNHANVDDEKSWCDLEQMLPYLKQMLSCLVCGNLLCRPCKSSVSSCLHYVCQACIGGRMNIKPSCSWCKDYKMFAENKQVRLLVLNFKKLCEFIQSNKIYSHLKTQQLDDLSSNVSHLSDIIDEGACFNDNVGEDNDNEDSGVTVSSLLAAHQRLHTKNQSASTQSLPLPSPSQTNYTLTTPTRFSNSLVKENYFERAKNLWNEMNIGSGTSGGTGSVHVNAAISVAMSNAASPPNGLDTSATMRLSNKIKSASSLTRKRQQHKQHLASGLSVMNTSAVASSSSMSCVVNTNVATSGTSSAMSPIQYSVISSNANAKIHDDDNIKIMLKRTLKKGGGGGNNLCSLPSSANGSRLINSLTKSAGKGSKKSRQQQQQQHQRGEKLLSVGGLLSRRGCRCGTATASPGKLTCCGQRCPCYIDKRQCRDCKCRGCRNTFGINSHSYHTPGGKVSASSSYYSKLLSSVCNTASDITAPTSEMPTSGASPLGSDTSLNTAPEPIKC